MENGHNGYSHIVVL